ncbi:MAG: 2,3-bisphosphoglycerate-dependent phosphoglycerate mutase [Xenococcaceae cyanobacterium MO_167.B27]|nr:2,3-bisphosphoglycerate-dependent phosphoglycerate mutase [Xenococcaceae cyanobacterium MO_167.B27]
MAKLILIRHGQSLWNAQNKFTGWVDVPLSERGRAEATIASCKLREKNYQIDVCFTSLLMRAMETAIVCLTECDEVSGGKTPIIQHAADDPNWHGWDKYEGDHSQELPIFPTPALDERYYGQLQGLNKTETAAKYGKEQVHIWRRSYDTPPPGGESLEDTKTRVIPFLRERVLAHIKNGETVLVAAHGNSLRSIIMDLDKLSPEEVTKLELATGVPIIYEFDSEAKVINKTLL